MTCSGGSGDDEGGLPTGEGGCGDPADGLLKGEGGCGDRADGLLTGEGGCGDPADGLLMGEGGCGGMDGDGLGGTSTTAAVPKRGRLSPLEGDVQEMLACVKACIIYS